METTTVTHTADGVYELPVVPVWYVAVCSCGWETDGCDTAHVAREALRGHLRWVSA